MALTLAFHFRFRSFIVIYLAMCILYLDHNVIKMRQISGRWGWLVVKEGAQMLIVVWQIYLSIEKTQESEGGGMVKGTERDAE